MTQVVVDVIVQHPVCHKGRMLLYSNLQTKLMAKRNCLKTQFWSPLRYKFGPSPRPHAHFDPIVSMHTKQVKKLCMGSITALL